ncbi:hypothetical protein C8Q80DRAFT_1333657 [Daedaleopsis nitida]|nr:hypothetical protein C8Q80DRAFT_1333657 [Daedaleopsis nitida]
MPHQDDPGYFFQSHPPAEVYGFVENPADLTDGEDSEGEGHDIYRGAPPTTAPPRSPSPAASTSSSSSSSSSSLSGFGGRLGAISAGVEHAISRWARAWMSSSSLSTSSASSSSASVVTQSKSQITRRRKRRPRSIATLHNARSELEIAARIRAREDLRNVPRSFVLYAPRLPIVNARSQAAAERRAARAALQDPILRTTSLDEATARLNAVLRERAKARRVRVEPSLSRPLPPPIAPSPPPSRSFSPLHHDYMLSDGENVARHTMTVAGSSTRTLGKGKQKAPVVEVEIPRTTPASPSSSPPPVIKLEHQRVPKAWWLDVTSPTWEDMCAIGKLLHLHPLTLEDILTQDPREKLELFPKLGYYFISFRAIESQKTRKRVQNLLSEDDANQYDGGIIGEVNMYLIVFREGICSFHFADLDEHVDRVRHRIMLLGDNANTSSEWIAHGLMDSIVDSFFPYLETIEKEVLDIDRHVFSVGDPASYPNPATSDSSIVLKQPSTDSGATLLHEKVINEKSNVDTKEEDSMLGFGKASTRTSRKPHFSSPISVPLMVRRARRAIFASLASIPRFKTVDNQSPGYYHPTTTVNRMARIRRLVTSLTRFLAVKSEVVAQVKKRMLTKGEWSLGNGTEDDLDVFVYMGDVQDHILTLQQSLAHYERMLSQSHPAYLSHLRLSVSKAKSGSDKAIVSLTVVSLGVLCVQTLIGLGSMNCEVPNNDEDNRYDVFAVVIAIAVVIIAMYLCIVRYWWLQAKRRRLKML